MDALKEREGYVSIPFSWLVKFCTHIDFVEPLTDAEREAAWRQKLKQQFGINVSKKAVKYISRAGKKNLSKEIEDLKKALWYQDRYIQKLENNGDTDSDKIELFPCMAKLEKFQ